MDYKEKYQQALERAKKYLYDTNKRMSTEFFEATERAFCEVFPELAKFEDERIKKELVDFIKRWKEKANDFTSARALWTSDEEKCDKYLAWLEKQSEKKLVERFDYSNANIQQKDYAEQKPTKWSEEDEKIIRRIIADIEQLQRYCKYDLGKSLYIEEIDWLKSLKERIKL